MLIGAKVRFFVPGDGGIMASYYLCTLLLAAQPEKSTHIHDHYHGILLKLSGESLSGPAATVSIPYDGAVCPPDIADEWRAASR